MIIENLAVFIISLFFLLFGARLVVGAVNKMAGKLKVSSFALSFFILGISTSISELAVGLNAVAEGRPEIFVGNLLGGIAVIFLLIIPLLAVLGNGVNLRHELDNKNLLLTLGVIAAPAVLILDKQVTELEGALLVVLYFVLFYFIQKRHGVLDSQGSKLMNLKSYSYVDILKVSLGIVAVFVFSRLLVEKTLYFSDVFNISPFYISLVLLSLGTNLPELSVVIQAVRNREKDVAMGDFLGSAAANTLLFGIFTLMVTGEVVEVKSFFFTFVFICLGLGLFYYFVHLKRYLSRGQGVVILVTYFTFIMLQLVG